MRIKLYITMYYINKSHIKLIYFYSYVNIFNGYAIKNREI